MPNQVPEVQVPSSKPAVRSTVLEVSQLSVSFDETLTLADLSFTVTRADALAVIGPNGSGKTVLFRALIGSTPNKRDDSLGASDPAWLRPAQTRYRARPSDNR
jgi:ATPase subunit of ABC transporter with duplicated ATPase domains